MVITIVIDLYGDKNNGTTITAMRTAEHLVHLGHKVKVIGWVPDTVEGNELNGVELLRTKKVIVPLFDGLISGNGFVFSTIDEKSIAEFIKGSDVVHLMLPFPLEAKARKVAKAMGIATTSAFHLQPDSISYNIHLGKVQFVNTFIYFLFRNWMFRHTRSIHTPSECQRDLMIQHHYRGDIRAISNGVAEKFVPSPCEKPEELKDKFVIMMCGRLSGEKRQDLIIKAVGMSKYNDKIQVILCGQGPKNRVNYLKKLDKKYLKNPAWFHFCSQDELFQIINYSDLYVHASDIESEAISCIEAFSCGKVPIISDSKFSATNHFALDDRSLFKAGDPKSLKEKIEYFYENRAALEELGPKYAAYGRTFDIYEKARELVKLMENEIKLNEEDKKLGRTYYSTAKERRRLRKVARKAGIENPFIFKKDVYHTKEGKKQYTNHLEGKKK